MGAETLPDFPVDDVTLSAVEHALGYHLTFEAEDGGDLDEARGTGADYSLDSLLDFLSGTSDDEGVVLLEPGDERAHLPGLLGIEGAPVYLDERPHYTLHDVIRALIDEVRRLRESTS